MSSKRALSGKSGFTVFQVLRTRPDPGSVTAVRFSQPRLSVRSPLCLAQPPRGTRSAPKTGRRPLTGRRFAPCFSGGCRAQGGRPEPSHGRQAVEPGHGTTETETRVRRDGDRHQPGRRQPNAADGVPVRRGVAPGVEDIHARLHRYGITTAQSTTPAGDVPHPRGVAFIRTGMVLVCRPLVALGIRRIRVVTAANTRGVGRVVGSEPETI